MLGYSSCTMVRALAMRMVDDGLVQDFTVNCLSFDGLACYTRTRKVARTGPNLARVWQRSVEGV